MMTYLGMFDLWFTDLAPATRVAAFARLGITHLQLGSWRNQPWPELSTVCAETGTKLIATCDHRMGSLTDPLDNDQVIQACQESLETLVTHGLKYLYLFADQLTVRDGKEIARPLTVPLPAEQQRRNLLQQTEAILKLVEQTEVTLLVQPQNRFDSKNPLIHNVQSAAKWIQHFHHPQLRLAFDCYQQQRDSGNLLWNLVAHDGLYPVVNVADVPTRQEPGTGEINFPNLYTTLAELGFNGYIGLNFKPSSSEVEALTRTHNLFSK